MCNPVRPSDNSGHGEPIMTLAGGLARRIVATRYADLKSNLGSMAKPLHVEG